MDIWTGLNIAGPTLEYSTYLYNLCSTAQNDNMRNLYWYSLASINSYHST